MSTWASAEALFPELLCENRNLAEALDDGEKAGILAIGTRAVIQNAIASGLAFQLFRLASGRSVHARITTSEDGDTLLDFFDVTDVVETTLSRQLDIVTGLPGRAQLVQILVGSMAPNAPRLNLALLHLGLNRFKLITDTLGHPIGDALLKLAASRVSGLLKPSDLLVRLDGDKFAILLVGDNQQGAVETLARAIIDVVSRTYLVQGHSIQVGASIGLAYGCSASDTPEEIIKRADLAFFKAKKAGRGSLKLFTPDMDREARQRRQMEIDLRRALALQELSLVYQPQFKIDDKTLVGFEALVRWVRPEIGPISPGVFIPLAEETGLIDALGEWVLRSACAEATKWMLPLPVSVNLSPLQFRSARLVDVVTSTLKTTGLAPTRLDLEITENALIDDTEVVLSALIRLKALGIKISLDDFGTGYSSLSYLQKFPFDKIKIDQSFVRDLPVNKSSAAIIRAVTLLGRELGMTTIAEGVETEEQLRRVEEDGCQQVQGYLTGKPLSPADASILIESRF